MIAKIDTSDVRSQLIDVLMRGGINREEAVLTADMAVHAATEAFVTLGRICEPLSGQAWLNAYALALQTADVIGETLLKDLRGRAAFHGAAEVHISAETRQ